MTSPRNHHCPLAKTTSGGREGGMWAKISEVVAVLAGCVGEIARGGRFGPAKPKTGLCGLFFGSGRVIQSTGSAEDVGGGVDVAVEMLGGSV